MRYSITTFGGMLPRIEPRLLQDANAQTAVGTKLRSGALVPFQAPSIVENLDPPSVTYQTLYQHEHTASDIFLTFEDDVDIVRGPVANDQYNRSYITGLDVPRVFDNTTVSASDTTIDSTNSYKLAVPTGAAGTLTSDGAGTGEITSTAYVYTYIREWSDSKIDEGQPTTPATDGSGNLFIDRQEGDTITLAGIEDAPDVTNNNVSRIAVYRVATGSVDAQYQLVIDFDIADGKAGSVTDVTWNPGSSTFDYDDSNSDEDLGEVLQATTWTAPSDDLIGLISLRNGSLVAFDDNVVYFSEPYQMHAWPNAYQVTLDHDIIGLGAFGNTVVALTDRFPILLNAQDPSLVIPQPAQSTSPCLSKRGIVEYENTVYYPSSDGLIAIQSGGIRNITQGYFTRTEWEEYAPATFEGAIQDGRYFGFFTNTSNNSTGFLIIDLEEELAAVSTELFSAASFFVDKRSDILYFIHQDSSAGWLISKWEGLISNRDLTWRSKIFTSREGPVNMSAARVAAEFLTASELAELNALLAEAAESQQGDLDGAVNEVDFNCLTFNGDIYEALRANYAVTPVVRLHFYVDGELRHTEVVASNAPFRLPAGIVGNRFEVEVQSNMPVYEIHIASSMNELV